MNTEYHRYTDDNMKNVPSLTSILSACNHYRKLTSNICTWIIVLAWIIMWDCDNDPGSHKEVHKNWSEVGIQKDVYLEQMCK